MTTSQETGKSTQMYLLSWGKSRKWVEEETLRESIFDLDEAAVCPESLCNTRKEKDKRSRRY
jgi:hypothetical protein